MLRNRYRAVTRKQGLMAESDHHTSQHPIPYFFNSPRFKAFTTKYLPDTASIKIPTTSILDHNKPSFHFGYPFGFLHPNQQPKSPKRLEESKGIGLVAVVDTLNDDDKPIEDKDKDKITSKTSNDKVLFGTKFKVQIPEIPPVPPSLVSSPRVITVREMELSEDYTCVKSHGPNPKTTHIYDNCVVKSYRSSVLEEPKCAAAESNFLSFCHTCNKNLEQKIDIYIYRGEKAFCSPECRYQEILLHDGEEN